uniref:Uncharacterized protein LOC111129424 n=1 Tax=Crassostrea virginica TaxID=6565 RepID=A0A8B8DUD9_CRAVI|nr:uncharacterized protein LOC111129424 [Crassostrea virginica]
MENLNDNGGSNNVTQCARFCGDDRRWIGLMSRFCYCLADRIDSTLEKSSCSTPCPGDRLDTCGGDQAMSIYKLLDEIETSGNIVNETMSDVQRCGYLTKDGTTISWKSTTARKEKWFFVKTGQRVQRICFSIQDSPRLGDGKYSLSGTKMDVAVVTKDDINKSPIDKLPANLQVWTALYRHDLNTGPMQT